MCSGRAIKAGKDIGSVNRMIMARVTSAVGAGNWAGGVGGAGAAGRGPAEREGIGRAQLRGRSRSGAVITSRAGGTAC